MDMQEILVKYLDFPESSSESRNNVLKNLLQPESLSSTTPEAGEVVGWRPDLLEDRHSKISSMELTRPAKGDNNGFHHASIAIYQSFASGPS